MNNQRNLGGLAAFKDMDDKVIISPVEWERAEEKGEKSDHWATLELQSD